MAHGLPSEPCWPAQRRSRPRSPACAAPPKASPGCVQVSEEAYAAGVEVANLNREDTGVEARSVEAALEALSVVGGDAAADRHPEK